MVDKLWPDEMPVSRSKVFPRDLSRCRHFNFRASFRGDWANAADPLIDSRRSNSKQPRQRRLATNLLACTNQYRISFNFFHDTLLGRA